MTAGRTTDLTDRPRRTVVRGGSGHDGGRGPTRAVGVPPPPVRPEAAFAAVARPDPDEQGSAAPGRAPDARGAR